MSKTIMIPECMNPFFVTINGKTYTYPSGQNAEVPDEVYDVIENHIHSHFTPSEPDTTPVNGLSLDATLTKAGQAADAKAAGDRLDSLSEEKVDKSVLGLVIGTDGKIYVAINGVATGSGIEITGGTASGDEAVDTTYQVQLSDGIILNTLMFQDEFDGAGLSSTWKPAYGHDNSAISNWWAAGEENLCVADSCLRLTMLRNNPNSNYEISGAKVETMQHGAADNYGFDTGYCEVKFKLDKVGSGIWPAIWCVGQTQTDSYSNITADSVTRKIHGRTWPWAGEIDQLDAMGCEFTPGLIYQTNPYDSTSLTMKGSEHKSLEADTWYTIGILKTKTQIKVYFSRTLIATFDITDIECFADMGEKIIINLSTGSLAGTLPDDVNEVNMYVDYVRVYSLSNTYVTLADQSTKTLLPEYSNGFACVAGRKFLLHPRFAENTQNTAMHWSSSNTSVAKVENGYIETVENGECVISATDASGSQIINFVLTVKDDAGILATSMVVTSSVSAIVADGSSAIAADIYPTNCDVLTPALEIVSGGDYCTVDGLTINNINSSGQDQEAVIRVKTNNPSVYQDITIILRTAVSYDVSPDNNLLCNYNVRTMTGGTSDSSAFRWDDAKGNGNQLYFPNSSGNLVFDGLGATSSNSIWYNSNGKNVISDNLPDAFSALVLVSLESGSMNAFTNGDTMNQYSAPAEKIVQSSTQLSFYKDTYHAAKVTMDSILSQKIVLGEIFSSNAEVSAVCVTADGTLYKTDPVTSLYESTGEMGNLRAFGGNITNGGFIGSFYQILVFNKVLSDEEIVSFATQMFEKN